MDLTVYIPIEFEIHINLSFTSQDITTLDKKLDKKINRFLLQSLRGLLHLSF
jgi:hypothetical protein